MSFEVLKKHCEEWADLVPYSLIESTPALLLNKARSLYMQSWFNYDFLAVAVLLGFQALESAFRCYYSNNKKTSFMGLVNKARSDGILSDDMADEIKTGVMLRNLFSHPTTGMEGSCQVTNIFFFY